MMELPKYPGPNDEMPYNPPAPQYGHPIVSSPQYGHPPVGSPQYGHPPAGYGQPTPNVGTTQYMSPPPVFAPAYVNTSLPEVTLQFPQTSTPMVVTNQPTIAAVPEPTCKDYLPWSIVNLILFCLPLGIMALFLSLQTRNAIIRRDYIAASSRSRSAFITNAVALTLGLCIHISWIAYVIYASVTAGSNTQYYYYYGYYGYYI